MEASEPVQPPPPPPEAPPPPPAPAAGEYPVRFDAERQEEYNRFLPLIKWLLAFPHYVVLLFLGIGALFATLIAFFAVIITGAYPRGLWDFVTGVHRWAMRVVAYVLLLTDQYPPFSLEHDPGYPVTVEWDYPETIDRWRPLVQWILIIPYAILAGILFSVAQFVALIGVFVILFTKNLPEGMFNLIVNPMRWQVRANSYAGFVVKQYPPFEWE
jgi:Domain of unknown function (DUF4389)